MENKLRLNAETKYGKFEIDIYSPIGEMFIIAIVPPSDENNNDKRYISWAVCEHHHECNGLAIWHIQTLKEYRRKGYAHKLILVLKCKHDILETNYETTNDDGYLFLTKEEFKIVPNIFKNDKNRKVLQWKKQK